MSIQFLQVLLSAALFLVLWRFISPIVKEFVDIVVARIDRTDRSEMEVFGERLEIKDLERELTKRRQDQSARGVKARETIIELAKSKALTATKEARDEAAEELVQFRGELAGLKSKLEREVESESLELSKIIIEKVSAGSGLNSQTIH